MTDKELQLKEYSTLLEEIVYYAIYDKVSYQFLLQIVPKNKDLSSKLESTRTLVNYLRVIQEKEDKLTIETMRNNGVKP